MPNSMESLLELIGLIVIFAVVLVVCYFTTRFVAGKQVGQRRLGNFEPIETYAITQNKYLQLVRMGSKYIVISVSKDTVSYITELEESEVCRLQHDASVQGKSFKELLATLTKDKTK